MALFQKSVLNKYLREIDDKRIAELYTKYSTYFLNLEIQQNIRDSKEEQFQEGFLRELFVNVLGYTINPHPYFNLTTELKNESGAKKADGAIMVSGKAIGVIELKSTTTKDLESIRQQAFDYKANHTECVYVVTSNFEKLRFYIDNAVDYEEFDLFTLSLEQFKLLYLCLNVDSIMAGIPKTAKIASLVKEENVTKKLYADYSVFKEKLFNSIISNDENIALANGSDTKEAKLILFKKTQKLMDRFLFIFFAEDRGLIPPNTISTILGEWEKLKSLDAYRPLYDRFKRHFDYINSGWNGDNYEVFAYNGGLFLPDEILDNIIISDEVLFEQTTILTKYDFDSEVDVNILGHIFEHSLNEIESMNAELEGQEIDHKKSKRKKDGVFYTPKYITKYIVDNTIGKLCEEKKEELSIVEEDYLRGKKGRKIETVKQLENKLTDYRDWLLQITVVDPACGSGAFLNQALEFLIREHRWIDEMTADLYGGGLVFQDVENSILENNLYGVDINDESVEIAKLSLWLRTAQKGRKLTSLNNNIKCGNSLIDDPEVAGDKAFKWEEEFPKVFDKGGFDVVIGNPPYLVIKGGRWVGGYQYTKESIDLLKINYNTASQQINTYVLFLELGLKLANRKGLVSQITPNTYLANEYSEKLRVFLLDNCQIVEVFNTGSAFDDASVETAIITYKNATPNDKLLTNIKLSLSEKGTLINLTETKTLTNDSKFLINLTLNSIPLLNKLNRFEKIGTYAKVWRGLTTGNDKKYISESKISELYKPLVSGSEVEKYYLIQNQKFVKYVPIELDRPREERIFLLGEKLISKFVGNRLTFCYDNNQNFVINTACSTEILDNTISPYYMLAMLNSNLLNFYFQQIFSDSRTTFPIMKSGNIEDLPFIYVNIKEQTEIIDLVNNIQSITHELQKCKMQFVQLIQSKYEIEKLTTKLQNWYKLDFKQFLSELKKKKVALSLTEEAEWMSYFKEKKAEAQELKAKIDATDNEIDLMVYKLYDMTYDEVLIVDPETKIIRENY